MISHFIAQNKKIGESALQNLKDYLYANVSRYPLFEASDAYSEDEETGNQVFDNDNDYNQIVML